jgi:hypothetical protein
MDTKKLLAVLIALLPLLDDDAPEVQAPQATKVAPKVTKAAPKATLRSMAAHAEATEEVATKLHESFPIAEGTLEFDSVGNVHMAAGLKSLLVVKEGDILVQKHQYGNYQMQVWTYGPTNVTFRWPAFLSVFGSPTRWTTVAIDASRGGLKEIPENTAEVKFLSEYLESEGGDNKFRIKWRKFTG